MDLWVGVSRKNSDCVVLLCLLPMTDTYHCHPRLDRGSRFLDSHFRGNDRLMQAWELAPIFRHRHNVIPDLIGNPCVWIPTSMGMTGRNRLVTSVYFLAPLQIISLNIFIKTLILPSRSCHKGLQFHRQ